jgi:hypothetical protein
VRWERLGLALDARLRNLACTVRLIVLGQETEQAVLARLGALHRTAAPLQTPWPCPRCATARSCLHIAADCVGHCGAINAWLRALACTMRLIVLDRTAAFLQ